MSTLPASRVEELARLHDDAERQGVQFRPFSQHAEGLTIDDAYAVQNAWVEIKQARGDQITGRKIGLTSRAMQDAMKIDEPDFGTLLESMMFEPGSTIEAGVFTDPRLEVELAFVLKQDLEGEHVTVDQVLSATEAVYPALELIAARSHRVDPVSGYTRTVIDTISDNAANAGYILAKDPLPASADLPWAGAIFRRNAVVEETGLAAGVLGHPAQGLCWLARRFAPHGIRLEAGHVYLAGSFTRPVVVSPGDEFVADFGPYGRIEIGFS